MIREFEVFGKTLKIEQDLISGGLGANVWDAVREKINLAIEKKINNNN